jgi:cytochrome c-type biogenesis protein CcmH/NrfG
LVKARDEFERAGDAASHYNMGIVYMAQQRYKRASVAFQAALQADPHLPRAAARARQSRALLARHGDTDGDD